MSDQPNQAVFLRRGSVRDGSATYYLCSTRDVKALCDEAQRYNTEDICVIASFPFAEAADLWAKIAQQRLVRFRLRGSWFCLHDEHAEDTMRFLSYYSKNPIARILLDFAVQVTKLGIALDDVLKCIGAMPVPTLSLSDLYPCILTEPAPAPQEPVVRILEQANTAPIECRALDHYPPALDDPNQRPPADDPNQHPTLDMIRPTRAEVALAHTRTGVTVRPRPEDYSNQELCKLYQEVWTIKAFRQGDFIHLYGFSHGWFSDFKHNALGGYHEDRPILRAALIDFLFHA